MTIPISLFIDDFGRSKKETWRPIHGVYGHIANLPRDFRNKYENMFFLSESDYTVSVHKLLQSTFDLEVESSRGFLAFHSVLRRLVYVQVKIFVIPCDNAMASVIANHGGFYFIS